MFGWKSLFRKRALDAQLDTELGFHIDKLTSDNIAAGMAPDEARRQAILEFGGREQVMEDLRDVHRVSIIETSLANLKSAFRFIRKSPSFSMTVILTLALGIGANSAVFSALDAILLRPLPFPDGDQLMRLSQYNTRVKSAQTFVAPGFCKCGELHRHWVVTLARRNSILVDRMPFSSAIVSGGIDSAPAPAHLARNCASMVFPFPLLG